MNGMESSAGARTVVRVPTRQLAPGMILAETVADGSGGVLLEQRTELSARAIALLTRRGVGFVYVCNDVVARERLAAAQADEERELRQTMTADSVPTALDGLMQSARAAMVSLAAHEEQARAQAAAAWQAAYAFVQEAQAGVAVRRRVDGGAALACAAALQGMLQREQHSLLALLHRRARQLEFDPAAHAVNVAVLAMLIAATLRLADGEQQQAGQAALLHDLGMMRLDPAVANDPSAMLGLQERMALKAHPAWGAELLATARRVEAVVVVAVQQHHEREDGSGYPQALDGKRLSRLGRILAVADTYERLVSPRAYRAAYLPHAALKIVLGKAGRELEREAVRALLDNLALYPAGTVVRLNTGEIALVVGANPRVPLRPLLRLLRNPDGTPAGVTVDLLNDKRRFIAEALSQVDPEEPVS